MHFYKRASKLFNVVCASHTSEGIFVAIFAYHSSGGVVAHGGNGCFKFVHRHTVYVHFARIGKHLILFVVSADDCYL